MPRPSRRRVLGGFAATGCASLIAHPSIGQARGPTSAGEIDLVQAKADGKVVLYTSLDTKIVDAVIKPFRDKHGIEVEYYRGGSNDVTSKVLAESDANRLQVDMVDASDVAAILLMKERGLLKPFKSQSQSAVAASLRDGEATWTADRLTQAVIQYNTKEFGAKPPTSWRELSAMKERTVYFSSPNGDGAPRIYTLAKHLGWDLVKSLAATQPLRVQTPQLVTQVLERGERGAAFLQNDNIAWRSRLEGKPTNYLFPAEGVPTEMGACGLLMASRRPHAAALFYEWWMSKEGQELLAAGGKYSSRNDVAPPTGMTSLAELKLLTLDYAEFKRDRSKVLEQLAAIFGGEWGN